MDPFLVAVGRVATHIAKPISPLDPLCVPFKYHAEHRHHIPKPRYRVTNWAEYDAALVPRHTLRPRCPLNARPYPIFDISKLKLVLSTAYIRLFVRVALQLRHVSPELGSLGVHCVIEQAIRSCQWGS
jgi:hypothetical protein